MRRVLLLTAIGVVTIVSTGCQCWDSLCRFERAKNEALFGWLRGPKQEEVCYPYDPMHEGCCEGGDGGCCDASGGCCEGGMAAPAIIPGAIMVQPAPSTTIIRPETITPGPTK